MVIAKHFFANTMKAFCMLRSLQQETSLSGVCVRSCMWVLFGACGAEAYYIVR
ncbi:hypothetical protein APHCRT_1486 [Anaplasma phagocytophilum str. CRT53-1]|uniref:Uncharacterized protein n=1 Tax=Anaplasma phagocytophilum str. CRT53-1 TaxID=1359157 RepID=A0A0F3PNN4_ANAPH|nr:hypothetical protein APHCRT_1558 [Anaplasma phagocytophilum str. CRT53-1]KJV80799.1 hypothetical protein APHCRT_1486 [Anaplasma phagocytophilum str. CRT53-1]